jgi:hypothetical protein
LTGKSTSQTPALSLEDHPQTAKLSGGVGIQSLDDTDTYAKCPPDSAFYPNQFVGDDSEDDIMTTISTVAKGRDSTKIDEFCSSEAVVADAIHQLDRFNL